MIQVKYMCGLNVILKELGTRVEAIPRDIDTRLYAYDPSKAVADVDDAAEELSELAIAPQ